MRPEETPEVEEPTATPLFDAKCPLDGFHLTYLCWKQERLEKQISLIKNLRGKMLSNLLFVTLTFFWLTFLALYCWLLSWCLTIKTAGFFVGRGSPKGTLWQDAAPLQKAASAQPGDLEYGWIWCGFMLKDGCILTPNFEHYPSKRRRLTFDMIVLYLWSFWSFFLIKVWNVCHLPLIILWFDKWYN